MLESGWSACERTRDRIALPVGSSSSFKASDDESLCTLYLFPSCSCVAE